MNKVIEYIHIKNSFAHVDTKIEFETGRNYIIGTYGSGKSEILELIGFAFFGSVSLRGKANTYPKLEVELVFHRSGYRFKIVRKTGDASLYMYNEDNNDFEILATSTTGVNNKIISLLGYDYNIYILSNFCQQGKLQYFSELTPAKRLAFIDKVSGMDDAKELSDWLQAKRKDARSVMETLRTMLREPVLPEGVDLETDYQALVDSISIDPTTINVLNQQMNNLRQTLRTPPTVTPLPEIARLFLNTDEELLRQGDEIKVRLQVLTQEKQMLRHKLAGMLKCPPALKDSGVTAEEANQALKQAMINSLEQTDIVCPSCSHTFNTDILKSHVHKKYSVKDLSNYIEWLSPENQNTYNNIVEQGTQINEEIDQLTAFMNERKLNHLIDNLPYGSKTLIDYSKVAVKLKEDFEVKSKEHAQILSESEEVNRQIIALQEEVNAVIAAQSKVSLLRTDYLVKQSQQKNHIELLSIYQESLARFEHVKQEFEIYNRLIKEVTSITNKIKLETIPAINHYASDYLNTMTQGLMSSIEITDNYDLIVDGFSINLRSGAQKDLSSLAFRLSLARSVIHGMLPLFIGDEIDASSPIDVANDITNALEAMSESEGYQMILVTHKDTANLENCNIINLG